MFVLQCSLRGWEILSRTVLPFNHWLSAVLLAGLLAAAGRESDIAAAEDAHVSFSRDVRPLLSDRCFRCHGPDRVTREADLRLDEFESVLGDRDGHGVVVPGNSEASELIRRISSEDDSIRMPPTDAGVTLSKNEIAVIRRWVDQGAEWEKHWAYIAPGRPDLPHVSHPEWPRSPIDRFILAKLDAAGLRPSPAAARRTLLRRVTFDLTGLPPTLEEMARFLADRSPGAYDSVVDRLLSSVRYGEKMALPWLEAARYADTSGYQEDYGRHMYPWRTWVISAFNHNMPFNRFVVEQMAGDLLPNATHEQKLATAFHRHHRINQEVGAIPAEFIVEYAIDRLETISTVFLGTTIGCARCHDHKYDPFSQQEFYELYAFLNNCADDGLPQQSRFGFCKPFLEHPTAEQQADLQRMQAEFSRIESQKVLFEEERDLYEQWLHKWDQQPPFGLSSWYAMGPFEHTEATRVTGFDEPFIDEPDVDLTEEILNLRWHEQTTWSDRGPEFLGGEFNTWYLFREIYVPQSCDVKMNIGASDAIKVWVGGQMIFSRREAGADTARAEPMTARLTRGRNELLFKLSNGGFGQTFVFELPDYEVVPTEVFSVLETPVEERSAEQRTQLYEHFRQDRLAAVRSQIDLLKKRVAKVMVMEERADVRAAHVLRRGSYDQPLDEVKRKIPGILPPLSEDVSRDRLGLAEWLVSSENPLTARVIVNRFWQTMFGTGLVKTAEDFGVRGEWPSHPELLDWLATEFIRTGWDVKQLHRLIASSATYQQSSRSSAELNRRDPENRLLARGPRFRLTPQEIRDQALFVSGLLVEKIGGPSVKPYQPSGLWAEVSNLFLQKQWYNTNQFEQDHGERLYRRSLYTFWKRAVPPPGMTVFDAGAREVCNVRRQTSNTPLQAMNLLNDVTYVEAARQIAYRMLVEGGNHDSERLATGVELVISRRPSEREQSILERGFNYQLGVYRNHPASAAALLAHGESPVPGEHSPAVLAAYTQMALLLLNLDEAINKQ